MKIFIPGPTEVSPEVLQAMAHPQIGHRTDELRALIGRITPGLQRLFGTTGLVFPTTASATGALEAALRNTVKKRLLNLECGAWSKKWGDLAAANGIPLDRQIVPLGKGHDPEDLRAALRKGGYDAVAVVWSETSTGVLNPLEELAEVVRGFPDVLLLVDAVSALAAVEIDVDALGVDVCVAGVQKAMAMPPGLGVVSVSARALARARTIEHRGGYLDFLKHEENAKRNETPSTPSTAHLWALEVALRRIHDEGMPARAQRHVDMAILCREWAAEHFGIYTDPDFMNPALTCVSNPDDVDLKAYLQRVRAKGFHLGSGYGDIKDSTFRIGHFGEHTVQGVQELLQAMTEALHA